MKIRSGTEIFDVERRSAPLFWDRRDAGRLLAANLAEYAGRKDVVVLALPRGGVPVAFEIATALRAPLDVLTVRKLGVPRHEEYAMGAIGSGGIELVNRDVVEALSIPSSVIAAIVARERRELVRRELAYRDHRTYPHVAGNTVIVVDDGVATGASMLVAVRVLRAKHPAKIVVAVPVGSDDSCALLREDADEVVCYASLDPFSGVSASYEKFAQVDDDEVRALLARSDTLRSSS
jgi:putative phosphoribosyl transferase